MEARDIVRDVVSILRNNISIDIRENFLRKITLNLLSQEHV